MLPGIIGVPSEEEYAGRVKSQLLGCLSGELEMLPRASLDGCDLSRQGWAHLCLSIPACCISMLKKQDDQ
jgi:hypothetical protein